MANLNVTYADLDSAASRLQSGKDELTQQLQQLQGLVHNLIETGFVTDSASGAFGGAYDAFTSGATQTVSAIDGLAGFLSQAARTLEHADEQLGAQLAG